jgi:hypothetical protein
LPTKAFISFVFIINWPVGQDKEEEEFSEGALRNSLEREGAGGKIKRCMIILP